MLSGEDDVDIHALKREEITISEIACHTHHGPKTIRLYLAGERSPGVLQRSDLDSFEMFVAHVTARLTEDPHLWSATLLDELRTLGFAGSHPRLTREVRDLKLRPAGTARAQVTKRLNAIIGRPPG
jgi:hypothetical protein